jgi:ribosomal protein S26
MSLYEDLPRWRYKMKWIKCSEQMPEDNMWVLVFDINNDITTALWDGLRARWIYSTCDCLEFEYTPRYWSEYPEVPKQD